MKINKITYLILRKFIFHQIRHYNFINICFIIYMNYMETFLALTEQPQTVLYGY